MERRYIEFSDDIDGSTEDVATHTFALDGTEYEIELSPANTQRLHQALALFTGHARVTRRPRGRRPADFTSAALTSPANLTAVPEPVADKDLPKKVRAWAAEQGIQVNARGRVPVALVEQYLAS